MSYCVNCGVQLADGEKACPLCGTPAWRPEGAPDAPQASKLYPDTVDPGRAPVRTRIVALVVALLLLIPIGVCLYADGAPDGAFSWSILVGNAEMLLFFIVFSPFLLVFPKKKHMRILLCVLIDTVAVLLFLLMAELIMGGDWFLPLGLPLTAVAALFVCVYVLAANRRPYVGFFLRTGVLFVLAAFAVSLVELVLSLYLEAFSFPGWSIYASVPCFCTGLVAFVLHGSPDVKAALRRKFFV